MKRPQDYLCRGSQKEWEEAGFVRLATNKADIAFASRELLVKEEYGERVIEANRTGEVSPEEIDLAVERLVQRGLLLDRGDESVFLKERSKVLVLLPRDIPSDMTGTAPHEVFMRHLAKQGVPFEQEKKKFLLDHHLRTSNLWVRSVEATLLKPDEVLTGSYDAVYDLVSVVGSRSESDMEDLEEIYRTGKVTNPFEQPFEVNRFGDHEHAIEWMFGRGKIRGEKAYLQVLEALTLAEPRLTDRETVYRLLPDDDYLEMISEQGASFTLEQAYDAYILPKGALEEEWGPNREWYFTSMEEMRAHVSYAVRQHLDKVRHKAEKAKRQVEEFPSLSRQEILRQEQHIEYLLKEIEAAKAAEVERVRDQQRRLNEMRVNASLLDKMESRLTESLILLERDTDKTE